MPAESPPPLCRRGKAPDFLEVWAYFAPGIVRGVQGVPTFCDSVFMVICCPFIDKVIVPLE